MREVLTTEVQGTRFNGAEGNVAGPCVMVRRMFRARLLRAFGVVGVATGVLAAAAGCATGEDEQLDMMPAPSLDGGAPDTDADSHDAAVGNDSAVLSDGGGSDIFVTEEGGVPDPCSGLKCKRDPCLDEAGQLTTVSGTIFSPALADPDPIYNAYVYVPNRPELVELLPEGASCDRCGEVSGEPLVSYITGYDGTFTLENVPVMDDMPLVIQLGKWRREVTIPTIERCTDNPLNTEMTRLPRNQSEGNIPSIAIATGSADPMECMFLKLGLGDEITSPSGDGRVHLYQNNGSRFDPEEQGTPSVKDLWDDLAVWKIYDMTILTCRGAEDVDLTHARQENFRKYTAAGGRIFTTHFGYGWIYRNKAVFPPPEPLPPETFSSVGVWLDGPPPAYESELEVFINTSFPKGQAFADWLMAVNASIEFGRLSIEAPRFDLQGVVDGAALDWLNGEYTVGDGGAPQRTVQHMTFNTPVGAPPEEQCGRVVYSNFHVSPAAMEGGVLPTFPDDCVNSPLTPQEKALEFMLFDLASCIQDDLKDPPPPQ